MQQKRDEGVWEKDHHQAAHAVSCAIDSTKYAPWHATGLLQLLQHAAQAAAAAGESPGRADDFSLSPMLLSVRKETISPDCLSTIFCLLEAVSPWPVTRTPLKVLTLVCLA
jgi:hypothetical protein